VLRNILWNEDKADEILHFNTIYGACGRTITYVCESTGLVSSREITTPYPLSTATYVDLFRTAIAASRAAGKRPRVAVFDIVASLPGVRIPFEALVAVCREEGILSLIDGAHGVGHIPLDLSAIDPDFFVSNCHKWLFTPRGCAVLYVPERNQGIIRSTLPTSHGYLPIPTKSDLADGKPPLNPLPPTTKPPFVANFEFVGTIDNTPYLCVAEAIKWREQVCGGEKAIYEYCRDLVRKGAKTVASILGTEVLENEEDNLQDCCMSMILLPIGMQGKGGDISTAEEPALSVWLNETLIHQYNTFLAITFFQGQFWVRLSAQVYLDHDDFEWAGNVLKDLSQRANKREFLAAKAEDAPLAGGIEDKMEELLVE
jgi:selenocysteine lyase/cysteine desulfurase